MKINGKQIQHNQHFTFSQIEYLGARVETLINDLDKKGYDVSVDKSTMSEAIYVTINDQKVSFRNHEYYNPNMNEYTVWLSQFNTWTEAKKYFFDMVLFQIDGGEIVEEKEEAPETADLIAEAKKKLENATNDSMRMILESRIKHLEGLQ